MIQQLQALDGQLFTAINSMHSAYFDSYMWLVSARWSCVLIVAALIYVFYTKGWRQLLVAVCAVLLLVLLADQTASGIIKPLVERLRPSHDPAFAGTIHTVNGYLGGQYGFVSSHAANNFGVALFLALAVRNRWATVAMMLWAVLISYSRIYLGVHFPGDILGGALVGMAAAAVVYACWLWAERKCLHVQPRGLFEARDGKIIAITVACNLLIIALVASFCKF